MVEEWWEDRTPLLMVSQVPDPHWLRNNKRGFLNHLAEAESEDCLISLTFLDAGSQLVLILGWWSELPSRWGNTWWGNLLEMSGSIQIKDKMKAKKPGHSSLTLAGKWDLYLGASSHHTCDTTVCSPPCAYSVQESERSIWCEKSGLHAWWWTWTFAV